MYLIRIFVEINPPGVLPFLTFFINSTIKGDWVQNINNDSKNKRDCTEIIRGLCSEKCHKLVERESPCYHSCGEEVPVPWVYNLRPPELPLILCLCLCHLFLTGLSLALLLLKLLFYINYFFVLLPR
jgi:hypothetical protein